jgi:hypothetical protein
MLCRYLSINVPTGKHQNGRMATERTRKNLGSFDTQIDTLSFYR